MNDLNKRVVIELLTNPLTLISGTVGFSLLLLSPILGTVFLGFTLIALCIGSIATNFIFNIDTLYNKVLKDRQQEQARERDLFLDNLDKKLLRDRDPRDQTALRNLRTIYNSFVEDLHSGKLSGSVPPSMLTQVDDIFNTCVRQLEKQHEIWETSTKIIGDIKTKLIKQREDILTEVEKSVIALAEVISEIRTLKLKVRSGELEQLQTRLKIQLDAAKATEDFLSSLDKNDMSRFSEYEKQ